MLVLSKKIGVLGLLTIMQVALYGQLKFTATISPATIGKNETAELKLMVENAEKVEQIIPPSLKNFIVLSGPNQQSGMENINGVVKQYIGITYIIKPTTKGTLTIPSAQARADGKNIRSNALQLKVTNAITKNIDPNPADPWAGYSPYRDEQARTDYKDYILKKGENAIEKINRNIFIKVGVSKPSCYVGEPVVVVYKLYTRLKSESSIIKNPAFNGFSVIDLLAPGNTNYTIEKMNGREYNVYTLRKSQLYPLQTGSIELETAEVENNIHFIKEEYLNQRNYAMDDIFQQFNMAGIPAEGLYDEKVTLRSKPAFVEVNPLPEQNKPANFHDAVGTFSIQSLVETSSFTTDDAGKLLIELTGEGNMTLINAPDVVWPPGVESFEPASRDQLNNNEVPVSGTKFFEYSFTVDKPGNYTLPPVSFSYFSVKEGVYKTISTKPINITIAKGTGKVPTEIAKLPAKKSTDFFTMIFTNRWLIILPLAIMLATGIFVWLKRDRRNTNKQIPTPQPMVPVPVEEKSISLINFKPLTVTEEKLSAGDSLAFYQALNTEMKKFLAEKFKLPVETINKKKIVEEADRRGIAVTTCISIQQLLDDIEWQLYTPFAAQDKMKELYSTANGIIHELNAILR